MNLNPTYLKIKVFKTSFFNILLISFCLLSIFTKISFADNSNPLFLSLSKKDNTAIVKKVVNSGLVVLDDKRRIRLIGLQPIDPPKRKKLKTNQFDIIIEQDQEPTTTVEERAFEYINNLLENKKVRIEFDQQYRDKGGYILGYIFLPDGNLVNVEILRQGFASLSIAPPNTKYASELRNAYIEARQQKNGIHSN